MKRVLGITGLIGTGKSVVAQTFVNLYSTPIFDSDSHAKVIYREENIREKIFNQLGFDPICENGLLNKEKLRLSLSNPKAKAYLEAIVHLAVKERFLEFEQTVSSDVILLESAILFSSGFSQLCHYTVVVKSEKNIRRERVLKRDVDISTEQFNRVVALQTEEEKLQDAHADYVINNCGNHSIIKAVEDIWNNIINRTKCNETN